MSPNSHDAHIEVKQRNSPSLYETRMERALRESFVRPTEMVGTRPSPCWAFDNAAGDPRNGRTLCYATQQLCMKAVAREALKRGDVRTKEATLKAIEGFYALACEDAVGELRDYLTGQRVSPTEASDLETQAQCAEEPVQYLFRANPTATEAARVLPYLEASLSRKAQLIESVRALLRTSPTAEMSR